MFYLAPLLDELYSCDGVALAKDLGLEFDYILFGCGADELINLIMRFELRFFEIFSHSQFVIVAFLY